MRASHGTTPTGISLRKQLDPQRSVVMLCTYSILRCCGKKIVNNGTLLCSSFTIQHSKLKESAVPCIGLVGRAGSSLILARSDANVGDGRNKAKCDANDRFSRIIIIARGNQYLTLLVVSAYNSLLQRQWSKRRDVYAFAVC